MDAKKFIKQQKQRARSIVRDLNVKAIQLPLSEMISGGKPSRKRSGKNRSQEVQAARKWNNRRLIKRKEAGKL